MNLLKKKSEETLEFLINFSHDIKTGLWIIENSIENTEDELNTGQKNPPSLSISKYEIMNLKNMILNILDYEKMKLIKRIHSHDKIINISKVIKKKIESYKTSTDLKLTMSIAPNLYVKISPVAFNRIINNLMDNSIKFTHKGGIDISLKSKTIDFAGNIDPS